VGKDLVSNDQLSEVVGKVADLSVVKHKRQRQEADQKKDEERSQEAPSVIVNGSGVCCDLYYIISLI